MHFLAAIENIFFLILIALVGLVRWGFAVAQNAKSTEAEKRVQPPAPNAPVQRAPAQTEEERVRRFMEALGVPASNAPPPKTPRRQITPRTTRPQDRRVRPIDPFPKPRPPLWNPQPVVVPPQPPAASTPPPVPDLPARTPAPMFASKATSPVFEVRVVEGGAEDPAAAGVVRQYVPAASAGWAARLANTNSLREAIVLREIFGRPRSLQDFDLLSLG